MYNENNIAMQNTTDVQENQENTAETTFSSTNEMLYKAWFHRYFMKDFGKLEKRLLDWWTGEGFFGITNLNLTEDGKTLDFMLRIGRSAYDEMSTETEEYRNEKTEKVVAVKKRQGWEIYSCTETPNLHVLHKTQKNVDKIQQLLMANIRSFKIEKFEYATVEGVEYIKSLTVKIYKRS